ncbi:MOSC domain-containing protein [Sulfurimonas marina]|uniref:MOSC domain-containing protein n=1 Tax=Sulfurimonas marina TaxID=2590551 RepID=A0A7M1AVC2_9BACT|nr:MOSC domain-containing protein [Sulfurimonas marina]QOP41364.1 MOSC domain-containing protein [Sulfurimonas marina]
MYNHSYPVFIHHIFTSPKHNYFTREKFDVGDAPTIEHSKIKLTKDQGLEGDRFEFSKYPITLISAEVINEISKELDFEVDPKLFRRNIIISGIHLNSLIGKRFKLGNVECEGLAHCAPCTWMNAVIAKNTYKLMKGRGGLRIRVLSDGELELGSTMIATDEAITLEPITPLSTPKIPT